MKKTFKLEGIYQILNIPREIERLDRANCAL